MIETRPHAKQPYPTCGMWEFDVDVPQADGSYETADVLVSVSNLGDWRMEALVGIHEAIEAVLCRQAGIKEEDVTAFDKRFEEIRDWDLTNTEHVPEDSVDEHIWDTFCHDRNAEPGDHRDAPYYKQHQIATGVERILAAELGVDWSAYEAKVNAL